MMRTVSIRLDATPEQAIALKALLAAYAEVCNRLVPVMTCSCCGEIGKQLTHCFVRHKCGFLAHADLNASRYLARIGSGAPLPRAAVNTPDLGNVDRDSPVCVSQ